MDAGILKKEQKYTYGDYLKWDDGKRWEIIDGVAYLMSPAPTATHQRISGKLFTRFSNYLEGKTCEIFDAPFDVILSGKRETKKTASSVIQPDIVVICDSNKIEEAGCFGSPDLIIEILSPSTSKKDMTKKFNLYQEHGVFEYWIVDPYNHTVARFYLDEILGKYKQVEYFHRDDTISPIIFPDLKIKLEDVFPAIKRIDDEDGIERI